MHYGEAETGKQIGLVLLSFSLECLSDCNYMSNILYFILLYLFIHLYFIYNYIFYLFKSFIMKCISFSLIYVYYMYWIFA